MKNAGAFFFGVKRITKKVAHPHSDHARLGGTTDNNNIVIKKAAHATNLV